MVTHIARVRINWVRLPILYLASSTGKMHISLSAFAPEILVSRDGFGSHVPRQPAHLHTQAESGAYLRDPSRVPRRRPSQRNIFSQRRVHVCVVIPFILDVRLPVGAPAGVTQDFSTFMIDRMGGSAAFSNRLSTIQCV